MGSMCRDAAARLVGTEPWGGGGHADGGQGLAPLLYPAIGGRVAGFGARPVEMRGSPLSFLLGSWTNWAKRCD